MPSPPTTAAAAVGVRVSRHAAATPAPPAPARGASPAAPVPDVTPRQDPGSSGIVSRSRRFATASVPPTGSPAIIPPMPDIVAHGKRPDVRACSLCHYPNGKGRPENAGVAGLPVSYFIQTMADFKADGEEERRHAQGATPT